MEKADRAKETTCLGRLALREGKRDAKKGSRGGEGLFRTGRCMKI